MSGRRRGGNGSQSTAGTPKSDSPHHKGSAGTVELENEAHEMKSFDEASLTEHEILMVAKLEKMVKREVSQVTDQIKDQCQLAVRAELQMFVQQITDKVDALEKKISESVQVLQSTVTELEASAKNIKDETTSLVAHMNSVITNLALQSIDSSMHGRKWSVIFQGVPGKADEPSDDTRKALIDVAKKTLKLKDTKDAPISSDHFAACHRLNSKADSAIIARFVDLKQRDRWLAHAKHLASTQINMSVDVPPCLRKAKNELMALRKELAPEDKKRSFIKHLPSWPYLVLHRKGKDDINHTFSKCDIIRQAIKLPEGEKVLYKLSAG